MIATIVRQLYEQLASLQPSVKIYVKVDDTSSTAYVNPSRSTLGCALYAYSRGYTAEEFLRLAKNLGVEIIARVDDRWVPWDIYSQEGEPPLLSWGRPWWVEAINSRGHGFGSDSLTPEESERLASELLSERLAEASE